MRQRRRYWVWHYFFELTSGGAASTNEARRPSLRSDTGGSLGSSSTSVNKYIKSGSLLVAVYLIFASTTAWSKDRNSPSNGLAMEFSASYDDALRALQEIVQDQTIHGT